MGDPVPSALKKQVEDIMAQANGVSPDPTPAPQAPEAPAPAPSAEPTPTPDPQPTPQPTPVPSANTPAAPDSDWKHRYEVINGKYIKETARLRDQARTLESRVNTLEGMLEQARQTPTAPAPTIASPTPAAPSVPASGTITDEMVQAAVSADQIEEFGIEFWRNTMKASQAANASMSVSSSATDQELKQVKATLEQQQQERFYSDLAGLVPNWEQVNSSDEFEAFLTERDALSGVTYGALLNEHAKRYDPVLVANIFNAFTSRSANPAALADPVASQVMPPTRATGQPADPSGGMSMAEYQDRLLALTAAGLSPLELLKKKDELVAEFKAGQAVQTG